MPPQTVPPRVTFDAAGLLPKAVPPKVSAAPVLPEAAAAEGFCCCRVAEGFCCSHRSAAKDWTRGWTWRGYDCWGCRAEGCWGWTWHWSKATEEDSAQRQSCSSYHVL